VTIHEPVKKLTKLVNEKIIQKSITTAINSLQNDFGIKEPSIAILGLNPHCGREWIYR